MHAEKTEILFIEAGHECQTVNDAGFRGKEKTENYSRSLIQDSMS